ADDLERALAVLRREHLVRAHAAQHLLERPALEALVLDHEEAQPRGDGFVGHAAALRDSMNAARRAISRSKAPMADSTPSQSPVRALSSARSHAAASCCAPIVRPA